MFLAPYHYRGKRHPGATIQGIDRGASLCLTERIGSNLAGGLAELHPCAEGGLGLAYRLLVRLSEARKAAVARYLDVTLPVDACLSPRRDWMRL